MGKLDINKKKKRDSLFASAFQLFTAKGIQNTSISDIVSNAGVAKGTFYLYFKDKFDIRNKLISHEAGLLFQDAYEHVIKGQENQAVDQKILQIVDYIIDRLSKDPKMLSFISKNLSWGLFKKNITQSSDDDEFSFYDLYMHMLNTEGVKFDNPEVMLFLIVELVGSSCYSSILYNEPLPIKELKPYLYQSIESIIHNHIQVISNSENEE